MCRWDDHPPYDHGQPGRGTVQVRFYPRHGVMHDLDGDTVHLMSAQDGEVTVCVHDSADHDTLRPGVEVSMPTEAALRLAREVMERYDTPSVARMTSAGEGGSQ